jgi:dimethylamine monooxygenase subunit A
MLDAALPGEPLYLPFEAGAYRMSMGLVARPPDELISLDRHYPHEMAERAALLERHGAEMIAAEPGSGEACAEMLARIADLLPRRFPACFARSGTALQNRITGESWDLNGDPLALCARLVQEDLCILQLRDGVPFLTAGILCFSPGWRLTEKLGRPLAEVHGPVPLYADRLARPVDRFMRHIAPGRLAERLNWGLYDNPALFRPGQHFRTERNLAVTAENAGATLFLRVERQTLSQLEQSGAVLFTIRTHVYPLHRVAAVPGAAARLAEAVRAMPQEMRLYKSFAPFAEPMLRYLDVQASEISGGVTSGPVTVTSRSVTIPSAIE